MHYREGVGDSGRGVITSCIHLTFLLLLTKTKNIFTLMLLMRRERRKGSEVGTMIRRWGGRGALRGGSAAEAEARIRHEIRATLRAKERHGQLNDLAGE